MKSFNITMPKQTLFGAGLIASLPENILSFGEKKILLLTGGWSVYSSGIFEEIKQNLTDNGIIFDTEKVKAEPSSAQIDAFIKKYKNNKPGVIVSIGGGSTVDTGKALSVGLFCEGSISEYFSAPGAKNIPTKKVPHIAVPTTAGSGSEITAFSVISDSTDANKKKRLENSSMLPDLSIVDPKLSLSCPEDISVYCGIDAFCHILEAYTSKDANSFIDDLMPDALNRVFNNIMLLKKGGTGNIEVRSEMAYAAMMSGIGCANTSLTVLHGLTETIGGLCGISHAKLSSALMYPVTLINMQRVQAYDPHGTAVDKYAGIGSMISGIDLNNDKHYVLLRYLSEKLDKMTKELKLPKLSALGVQKEDFYNIVSSVNQRGNPVVLNEADLLEILELAY